MEKMISELKGKLKALSFRTKKTDEIIAKGDKEALERHQASIANITEAVSTQKESIEEKKFSKGESEEEVSAWGAKAEELLAEADECTRKIAKHLKSMIAVAQDAETLEAHTKAMQYEKMLMEQKLNQEQAATAKAQAEQLEFQKEKMKLEHQKQVSSLKENASASITEGTSAVRIAKMPKLVISKFEGTPQDWVRFSGQFSSQIDSTSEPATTKFSYLKELVDVKVRKLIDGLPFTEEGYLKAKALLEKRYGQTSEVVGAYVRNILELPTIRERDVAKIHDFYEKLLFNVESLLTLKKLNELDAAARFTFDKLEVIKNELALIDGNWRDWTFKEFLETLKKWTINNPLQGGRKQKAFFNREERMHASRGCVYCTSTEHRAVNCTKVTDVSQRKSILASKRLCFNCTGPHRAALCKSQTSCHTCKGKHHTSICEKPQMLPPAREPGMTENHVGKRLSYIQLS